MTANLIARLEQAQAGDRELDAEIWLAFTPGATRNKWSYTHTATGRICEVDETRDETRHLITVPSYTASVDATLSLAERVLPGMRIINTCDDTLACSAKIWVYPNGLSNGGEYMVEGMHEDMPIALCIAILRAQVGSNDA